MKNEKAALIKKKLEGGRWEGKIWGTMMLKEEWSWGTPGVYLSLRVAVRFLLIPFPKLLSFVLSTLEKISTDKQVPHTATGAHSCPEMDGSAVARVAQGKDFLSSDTMNDYNYVPVPCSHSSLCCLALGLCWRYTHPFYPYPEHLVQEG